MATPNRSANGAARRKVIAQVKAEEDTCGICGRPVDKTLTWAWGQHGPRCKREGCAGCVPHPMRPEVDEIVPFSKGGSAIDRSNCRLTHRECNRRRGNGTTAPKAPALDAFPVSACWLDVMPSLYGVAGTP